MRIKRTLIYEGEERWIRNTLLNLSRGVYGEYVFPPGRITESYSREDCVTRAECKLIDDIEEQIAKLRERSRNGAA